MVSFILYVLALGCIARSFEDRVESVGYVIGMAVSYLYLGQLDNRIKAWWLGTATHKRLTTGFTRLLGYIVDRLYR